MMARLITIRQSQGGTWPPHSLEELAGMLEHVANSLDSIDCSKDVSPGNDGHIALCENEVADIAGELLQLSDRLNNTLPAKGGQS